MGGRNNWHRTLGQDRWLSHTPGRPPQAIGQRAPRVVSCRPATGRRGHPPRPPASPRRDRALAPAHAAELLFDGGFGGSKRNRWIWYPCSPYARLKDGCENDNAIDLDYDLPANVGVTGGNLILAALRQEPHGHHDASGMVTTRGRPRQRPGLTSKP